MTSLPCAKTVVTAKNLCAFFTTFSIAHSCSAQNASRIASRKARSSALFCRLPPPSLLLRHPGTDAPGSPTRGMQQRPAAPLRRPATCSRAALQQPRFAPQPRSAAPPGPTTYAAESLTAAFGKLLQQRFAGQRPFLLPPPEQQLVEQQQQPHVEQQQQQQHVKQQQQQQAGNLLQCAADLAPQLEPQQASLVLYVCAKCQLQCSQALVQALLQRLHPHQLQQLPPAGQVNALWALAVLQVQPGAAWMDALYAATTTSSSTSSTSSSTALLAPSSSSSSNVGGSSSSSNGDGSSTGDAWRLSGFNKHQAVQLLWAAGRLRARPPVGWLQGLLASLFPHLHTLSPTELSSAIWGLARIGFRPDQQWLKAWFHASRRSLPHSSPDSIACQVASLGVLRVMLSRSSWLVALRRAVAQQLHVMRPHHIASILCGLAKRRSPTPPHLLRLVLTQQLRLLQQPGSSSNSASPRDVAATVWALPLLLYPTAVSWAAEQDNAVLLKQLAAASLPLLPRCSVGQLVQLVVGFVRLGFYPGAHWLKLHENAVAQHRLGLTDVNRLRLQAARMQLWRDH